MVTLSGGCNITPPSAISIQHRAHKEHSGGISFTLNSYSIFIAPKSLRLSLLERRTISQSFNPSLPEAEGMVPCSEMHPTDH